VLPSAVHKALFEALTATPNRSGRFICALQKRLQRLRSLDLPCESPAKPHKHRVFPALARFLISLSPIRDCLREIPSFCALGKARKTA